MTDNQSAVLALLAWAESTPIEQRPAVEWSFRPSDDGIKYRNSVRVYTGEPSQGTYVVGWEFGSTLAEAVAAAIDQHAIAFRNPGNACSELGGCRNADAVPMGMTTVEGEIAW